MCMLQMGIDYMRRIDVEMLVLIIWQSANLSYIKEKKCYGKYIDFTEEFNVCDSLST